MNIRAFAARIVHQVLCGKSLSEGLLKGPKGLTDQRDQAFLQAMCYGVCRSYFRLEALLRPLLKKPLKEKDLDIHCLLLVGLYQLTEMRVRPHATIAETVQATVALKKPWAKNLVNAVLRQFERAPVIPTRMTGQESGFYSHPNWWIEKVKKDWPHDWESILIANQQMPPFSLRVNQRHHTRENYLEALPHAKAIPETQHGIVLDHPIDVSQLPGFANGDVSVQDGAAQLAVELLDVKPGQKVLDACAAPGGKTGHLLESVPSIELIAVDRDENRLQKVRDNLKRLQLEAHCIQADIIDFANQGPRPLFDRILFDAPCSASGVVRRHPDIKLLRRATDIATLARAQQQMLKALWPLLKPNGLLLYVTCSIFPEENGMILSEFMAHHADAIEENITAAWGRACPIGRQILPGMHGMDGFYFGRLRKGT